MKVPAQILSICFFFLLVLNGAHVVESRPGKYHFYSIFVFGDSYADTGNLPKSELNANSRQWYEPYGTTSPYGPSGRFSDGFVQSDIIAKMLGRAQGPKAYKLRMTPYADPDLSGATFATGGAGVFEVPSKVPTLNQQIQTFKQMIKNTSIFDWQVKDSVALVAISGNDYQRAANMTSDDQILGFIGNVTTEIAHAVKRLRKLGVTKVLVNSLHPVGCTPWQTRASNYTSCNGKGNMAASIHNDNLRQKLAPAVGTRDVHVLDIAKAFSAIVEPAATDGAAAPSSNDTPQFAHTLEPCCKSFDADGYCGQVAKDDDGTELKYTLCDNPEDYFYFDDVHPTEAGWNAVMDQLKDDMKDFLEISN